MPSPSTSQAERGIRLVRQTTRTLFEHAFRARPLTCDAKSVPRTNPTTTLDEVISRTRRSLIDELVSEDSEKLDRDRHSPIQGIGVSGGCGDRQARKHGKPYPCCYSLSQPLLRLATSRCSAPLTPRQETLLRSNCTKILSHELHGWGRPSGLVVSLPGAVSGVPMLLSTWPVVCHEIPYFSLNTRRSFT